jgi:hypothetical protein
VDKHDMLEVSMKFYGLQVFLNPSQHEMLTRIAEQENRSLSEIVREIVDRELRYRQRRQMVLAASELQVDYGTDPDLRAFDALDGDKFL